MTRPVKSVTLTQISEVRGYRVSRTTNTTKPRVYEVLKEAAVNALIGAGVKVTITK